MNIGSLETDTLVTVRLAMEPLRVAKTERARQAVGRLVSAMVTDQLGATESDPRVRAAVQHELGRRTDIRPW